MVGDTAGRGDEPQAYERVDAPLAPDRPVVDGTEASSAELRAEVDRHSGPDQARIHELRAEVGATAAELANRFDVPARVRAGRDDAAASLRDRLRSPAAAPAAAALLVLAVFTTAWWIRRAGDASRP